MYQAKVLDYYISANAIFYRVNGKLDRALILNKRRNQGESREEAKNRWGSEQHWRQIREIHNHLRNISPDVPYPLKLEAQHFIR